MASVLKKRKRSPLVPETTASSVSEPADDDILTAFKRAFEAKFKPLKEDPARKKNLVILPAMDEIDFPSDSQEDESDWSGLSDAEAPAINIIEHGRTTSRHELRDRREEKAFMSSKPPTRDISAVKTQTTSGPDHEQGGTTEAANLNNDLALQRLLVESHLLEGNGALVGRNRVKALDLRLRALGAKTRTLAQKNMPMSLRKGIDSKTQEREGKRRTEAKENGVILERATATSSSAGSRPPKRKRTIDVGAPSVGRFRGGALILSERDVRGLESRSGRGGRGGKTKGSGGVRRGGRS